jgi:hypothetical protein
MEQALFRLLLSRPKRSAPSDWLTVQVYKALGKELPKSSRVTVNGTLRSLIKKVEENREPFRIIKTNGKGPYSSEFRIVSR